MLVDSHCHLDFPDLAGNLPDILRRMQESQVGLAVCIGVNLEDFPNVLALAESHSNLYATVGVPILNTRMSKSPGLNNW